MATERLKFRCYRCNQLLAASPHKAGTVVSCPKCQADLLVPPPEPSPGSEPDLSARPEAELQVKSDSGPMPRVTSEVRSRAERPATTSTSETTAQPEPAASTANDFSAMIPPDLADLRPEDLRVEAEFFQSLTRASSKPATEPISWPAPDLFAPPTVGETSTSGSPSPVISEIPAAAAPVEAPRAEPEAPELAPKPPALPSARPEVPSIAPQIEIEPPTILPPGHELGRIREVVLPASVVLAWSLFVLLGITSSFVAGLLMGHFIWRGP